MNPVPTTLAGGACSAGETVETLHVLAPASSTSLLREEISLHQVRARFQFVAKSSQIMVLLEEEASAILYLHFRIK
jgi:hypothetical protein